MSTRSPSTPPRIDLLIDNWRHELDAADLYRFLADRESDERHAGLMREMAEAEVRHADVMAHSLRDLNIELPQYKIGTQTRLMKLLAGVFGPRIVYPLLHGMEIGGTEDYLAQDAATAALAPDERSHARTLGELSKGGGERWHRTGGGGILRAAVFGVSDGLVSNLSLVMGFAGASADAKFVLLAGLSGLLAGASSMAAGEYVSMQAQRELFERQIELESTELYASPDEEREELALIYRAKGLSKVEAEGLAGRLSQDPQVALDTLVREELGLDPSELGSPVGAATWSFLAFAGGALLPVLPFFFGAATINVVLSLLISGAGLFSVGAALTLFTGRSAWFSGGRQLLIGGVAASLTFGIGLLIGVSTGV